MLFLRRYRAYLVFAAISVLAFIHFSGLRARAWSSPEIAKPQPPPVKPAEADDDGVPHQEFVAKTTAAVDVVPDPTPLHLPTHDHDTQNPPVSNRPQDEENSKHPANKPAPTPAPLPKVPIFPEDEYVPSGKGRLEVPDFDRSDVRWKKLPEHFPLDPTDIIALPTATPKKIPKIQFDFPKESGETKQAREKKLNLIKESFRHAWTGYKENAMGRDELSPVSGEPRDPFMGWGATLVDSLDTLWIMDLKEEFEEAVEATKKIDFATSSRKDIPVFETAIRYLGGLIGAYDISGGKYQALLDKALELAEILMGVFDTPNRMPVTYYNWAPAYVSQPHRAGTRVVLAELGSLSVEFTRLAQITGENRFYDAVARITNELEKWQSKTKLPGLWPAYLDASGCKKVLALEKQIPREFPKDMDPPTVPEHRLPNKAYQKRDTPVKDPVLEDAQPADYNAKPDSAKELGNRLDQANADLKRVTGTSDRTDDYDCEEQGLQSVAKSASDRFSLAALEDSTYEYLPKEYLLLGGVNDQYRTMYEKAMDTARKYLLFRPMLPEDRDVRFLASVKSSGPPKDRSDLQYTYQGSHLACFAGGMFGLGAKAFGLKKDLDIAKKLTDGCVWAYESTTTGLMPENFELVGCDNMESCEWNQTRYYDALDPYESSRKARVEFWEEQKARLEQGSSPNGKKVEMSELEAKMEMDAIRDKIEIRDAPGADESPSKTTRDMRNPVQPGIGPRPSLLSHAEYAEKRIKEERIPAGMTQIQSSKYILRPEAIESVFIMYRITGENYWREKGWKMFNAVAEETRTDLANSAIQDVTSEVPIFIDEMESFWLGETLKYFYLLFSDPEVVSLDEYVFNTEAHPLKRPASG